MLQGIVYCSKSIASFSFAELEKLSSRSAEVNLLHGVTDLVKLGLETLLAEHVFHAGQVPSQKLHYENQIWRMVSKLAEVKALLIK